MIEYVTLQPEALPSIASHLQGLSRHDRQLRFSQVLTDEALSRYLDRLSFDRDLFTGACREGQLIGFVHLARYEARGQRIGEIGISVAAPYRAQRVGRRLFAHTMEIAQAHGLDRLEVNYLGYNIPMHRLALSFGGEVERDGDDCVACIELPTPAPAAHPVKRLLRAIPA